MHGTPASQMVEPYYLWLIFKPDGSPFFSTNYQPIAKERHLWEDNGYTVHRLRIHPSPQGATIEGLIIDTDDSYEWRERERDRTA